MFKYLYNCTKRVNFVINDISGILFMVMAVVYFSGVVNRYIFNSGIVWAEELCRYLMVWTTYFGVTLNIFDKSHTSITFIEDVYPKMKRRLSLIQNIIVFIYMVAIAYFGMMNMSITSTQKSPNMQIPMNLVYVGIPVACILGSIYCIEIILDYFKKNNSGGSEI